MQTWIIYTMLYAVIVGFFHCSKKKAVEKNSIYEVLAMFSTIAFLAAALTSRNNFNIELSSLFLILIKSSVIVVAWLLSLHAMSKMSMSLYSVINLSRIIFSIMMSVIILGEKLTTAIILGAILIITGLILVNKVSNTKENKEADLKTILILLVSCFFNSISGIIDKTAVQNVTPTQLQFWFLFFLAVLYWIIIIVRKQKVDFKNAKKNYWILAAALCIMSADRFLFMANAIPESKVSMMTLIKQISTIEGILLGKLIFNEKNIIKKLICSVLIIIGIALTTFTVTTKEDTPVNENINTIEENSAIADVVEAIQEEDANMPELTEAELKQNVKTKINKYLDLQWFSNDSNVSGGSIWILNKLGLETEEKLMELNTSDTTTYIKTNVRYEDFKIEMLKFMTEEAFERDYSDYKNIDGYVAGVDSAGGYYIETAQNIEIISQENNTYTLKVTLRDEEVYEHFMNPEESEFITEEECYRDVTVICKYIDDTLVIDKIKN